MARSLIPVVAAVALVSACNSVTEDPDVSVSAQVIAVFSPNAEDACLSDLPFPTDLARNPYTGLLDIPYCRDDSADTIAVKTTLRTQNGYALATDISFHFNRAVSPSSLTGNVGIYEAASGAPVQSTPVYFDGRNHTVVLQHAVLQSSTTYVVVVADGIVDEHQEPVVADQTFTFLKSETALIDDKGYSTSAALTDSQANGLERVRKAYVPILSAALQATGLPRARIALAWGFTTTTETYDHMSTLAAAIRAAGSVGISPETAVYARDHALLAASGLPYDEICSVHTGHVILKSVLGADDMLALKADGTPILTDVSVDYVMTVPKVGTTCDPTDPPTVPEPPIPAWDLSKVAVFAHGLGRCKNDALALANAFATAGWAVLSLDGPRAGGRMLNPLGDQNLDGCPDQPATPELIAVGMHDPNPFVLRDGLREWALELVQAAEAIETQPWKFVGQDFAVGTPEIGMVGHSWGGIAASLAAPLAVKDSVRVVRALALSATPAGLGDVFTPLITTAAALKLPGATADEIALAAAQNIAVFRWALEPVDPLFAVSAYPTATSLPVLTQLVATGTVDVPLHTFADQERLRAAFGREDAADVTFNLAPSGSNICDEPELAVGSLLKPCVASTTSANYLRAAGIYAGMQRQVVKLIAARVICKPDINVICL